MTDRTAHTSAVQIGTDFPGGNIVVEAIDGDDIRLHQDLRDTERDWFYWCFDARGAAGLTLRFHFTRSPAIGVHGPAISLDGGDSWRWLGAASTADNSFTYAFAPDADAVRFSFGMPYQLAHWNRFIRGLPATEHLSLHRLCTTPKGRDVPYALLGKLDGEPAHRVAVTCRHHCCEMMPNYTLEGLIRFITESPADDARWLRENVAMLIVPFVDLDGVEDGDQGKGRRPRDHGRDYEGQSLYGTTGAIRELLPSWGGQRLHMALDLHCPGILGSTHEVVHIVGSRHEHIAREQDRFAQVLEACRQGPLPFLAADLLPFGTSWNIAANTAEGRTFPGWAATLPGIRLAATLELPYANARGVEVNAESARLLGPDLAAAVARYLQSN